MSPKMYIKNKEMAHFACSHVSGKQSPQRERERLFKQQADGLFNVFELHWLTQREKEEKGERGESRQVGCVNTRLMVCSLKSVFNSVHLLLLYKRNNEVVMKRDKHRRVWTSHSSYRSYITHNLLIL